MPLYTWQGHELNFEPRIWDLLEILAREIYDGNKSRAVNSLVLFSAIHFFNERAKGRTPTHWITAPAMKDGAQLDSLLGTIERIVATGVPEDFGKWWEHELERKIGDLQCPHCGEPVKVDEAANPARKAKKPAAAKKTAKKTAPKVARAATRMVKD
jgi:hypothetical protein